MKVALQLVYEPWLAGGAGMPQCETLPIRLHVYGTHELRRMTPSTAVVFREQMQQYSFSSEIEWRGVASQWDLYAPLRDRRAYTFAEVDRLFEPFKVSRAARIVVNSYASTQNTEGQKCWVRAGSTEITQDELRSILDGNALKIAFLQNAADVDVSTSRGRGVLRTDDPLCKGTLLVRSATIVDGTRDDFEQSLLERQPAFDMSSTEEIVKAAKEMNIVIDRNMATFFHSGAPLRNPTISPLLRFHAPVSMRDQLVMASLGYALNKSMKPPPLEFFTNALTVVLQRRALSVLQMLSIGNAMFDTKSPLPPRSERFAFISLAAGVVTLFATSLAYIEDFANKNKADKPWDATLVEGDEDNKIARAEGADDCEGLALESTMIAFDLIDRAEEIIEGSAKDDLSKLLWLVVRVLRLYVPGQTFGAVTNAKLAMGCASEMSRENTLAHTYCTLIPFDKFDAMLSTETRASISTTDAYRQMQQRRPVIERLQLLPVAICEGTAMIEATMLLIDLYYDETQKDELETAARVMQFKSKIVEPIHDRVCKTRLYVEMLAAERYDDSYADNRRDLSVFYKWVNGFTTPMFAESRVIDMALYYEYGDGGSRTYGVRFNDFLMSSFFKNDTQPKIRMMPTTVITKREAAVIDNILALEEAVPNILSPSKESLASAETKRELQTIVITNREPTKSTVMHKGRILVSTRAHDIGDDEIAALKDVASMQNWASITVDWRPIARVNVPNLEPMQIVDIIFEY